jgi:hypothetical protein
MNERPVDVVEDYFDRVTGIKFQGSLVDSESKLIGYFHMAPPAIWLILPDSWG